MAQYNQCTECGEYQRQLIQGASWHAEDCKYHPGHEQLLLRDKREKAERAVDAAYERNRDGINKASDQRR